METVAVVGAQWGDEGKGKLVDVLAGKALVCARYNGGSNAGHTIIYEAEEGRSVSVGLHLLPCGIMHSGCENVIGNGVVVHLPTLARELDSVAELCGMSVDERISISSRAHLVFNFHQLADGINEDATNASIGTTRRGIGPTYAAKALRISVRAADLKRPFEEFQRLYEEQFRFFARAFPALARQYDPAPELELLRTQLVPRFAPHVKDLVCTWKRVARQELPPAAPAANAGQAFLAKRWHAVIEGANAAMLDLNVGTYPFCTSSDVLPGGIGGGLSLDPRKVKHVISVVKAYTTRVGAGPFLTEDTGELGQFLQREGSEVGVSTGRSRRCGWLDLRVVRYTNYLTNPSALMLTKLDILSKLPEIKVAVNYLDKQGNPTDEDYFPASLDELAEMSCEYRTFPGWECDISHVRAYSDLPPNARHYVEEIERFLGVPILFVGIGPKSADILTRDSALAGDRC